MPNPSWSASWPDWNTVDANGLSLAIKFNTVPWRPGTENRNPEVEIGPRADTSGCQACKVTELEAWADYLEEYIAASFEQSEAEQVNRRRLAWIAYLDAVYDCFENSGCFDA